MPESGESTTGRVQIKILLEGIATTLLEIAIHWGAAAPIWGGGDFVHHGRVSTTGFTSCHLKALAKIDEK